MGKLRHHYPINGLYELYEGWACWNRNTRGYHKLALLCPGRANYDCEQQRVGRALQQHCLHVQRE